MLIDSHCHLDRLNYESLHDNPQQVVELAKARGVGHMLCVSISLDEYQTMRTKLSGIQNISFSCGVHPLHAHETSIEPDRLKKLALESGVIAIGETGLDYFYSPETHAIQRQSFIEHLKICREIQKPIIIHTRDAKEETLACIQEYIDPQIGGILHCFTEDYDMAMTAIECGFYISASGIISFKSAEAVRETFRKLPLERLLVETDSPYLAPAPYRGEENQPAYVHRVAECLAEIRGMTLEGITEATTQNFKTLFKMDNQI
ncbi:TatD family hydrolase [Celerinatantimonas sp. YJH-8]|uniref:TatD family hydrolase n=1 Tax=Celerinatantimonas sp. YJH-8 TaxID=3228714 RepID=UPI0038C246EE